MTDSDMLETLRQRINELEAAAPQHPGPSEPLNCPDCSNQGWYAVGCAGDFEQVQCRFCYTEPNSVFNRTQSYNEMSGRYIALPDENYMPTLDRIMDGANIASTNRQASGSGVMLAEADALTWLAALADVYEHAQKVYELGLVIGVPKELARLPVPVARYSRMRASANLRNWLAFLSLRLPKNAQWEIRQFAQEVGGLFETQFPRTYALFMEAFPNG